MKRWVTFICTLLALFAAALPTASQASPTVPITHVIVIAFENHSRDQVIGTTSAPYITGLASTYGEATGDANLFHPSLPNYMALSGGTNAGITTDCLPSTSCQSTAGSIFGQSGGSWKAYEESMPSNCDLTDSGHYAAHHNPPVYYTKLASACTTKDVPLPTGTPNLASEITWITPNGCHNMHSNTCIGSTGDYVKDGDDWLSGYLPTLLNSARYLAGDTAIILWWDENGATGGPLPFVVISPYTSGVSYSAAINHYTVLWTIQDILGETCLANSCGQTSLATAFNLK